MSMVIKHNMDAMRTLNQMTANHVLAHKHLMKVSTGMKVRNAQDDASAYAISEHMRVRIRALEQAHSNTQNGSSMMKTAEGAVANILDALRTLKEKAIDAANDSNSDEDCRMIQREFDQLIDQIDEDALITFNNKYLIDGTRNFVVIPGYPAGTATASIYYNQNLAKSTLEETRLTELVDRAGNSLGIQSGDKYQVSWVLNGETNIKTDTVGDKTIGELMRADEFLFAGHAEYSLQDGLFIYDGSVGRDKFHNYVYSPNREEGLSILSVSDYELAGFTISIMDSEGNIKKSANAALQFKQLQRSETYSGDNSLSFHVGADANFATKFILSDMRSKALGLKGDDEKIISISTKEDANAAINVLDNVINKVLDQQSDIGSAIARLERTATNLTTQYTDDQASESVIRDADVATEMAGYLKYNVLSQASQAMLAQANQNPMNVLALIGETEE